MVRVLGTPDVDDEVTMSGSEVLDQDLAISNCDISFRVWVTGATSTCEVFITPFGKVPYRSGAQEVAVFAFVTM